MLPALHPVTLQHGLSAAKGWEARVELEARQDVEAGTSDDAFHSHASQSQLCATDKTDTISL